MSCFRRDNKSTPIYWLENASLIILCLVPNNQNIKSHIKCTSILYWVFFHIVLNMLKIGKEKMQCPYCGHKSLNRGNHICRTIFALISPQTFVHFLFRHQPTEKMENIRKDFTQQFEQWSVSSFPQNSCFYPNSPNPPQLTQFIQLTPTHLREHLPRKKECFLSSIT